MANKTVDPSLASTDPGTRLDDLRLSAEPPDLPPRTTPNGSGGRWKVWLKRAILLGFLGFFLGVVGVVGIFWYYSRDLPPFTSLADYHPPQVTKVYAADGTTLVGEIFDERRTVIPIEDVPSVMVQALISAEDKNFFQHSGVDYLGILKAFIGNLRPGAHTRGASTLTQQIVKTMLLSNERKLSRKVKEALLAHSLEKNFTKQDILYLYLNQIFFGNNRYGIEEAARFYFGKSAKDLDVGEAALLACVPKDPNKLNPRGDQKRVKERQTYVLHEMVQNGYISAEVAEREIAKPITVAPLPETPPGGYYAEEVKRLLVEKLGADVVQQGGLQVETMMNLELQKAGEDAMKAGLRELDKRQGWRGATARLEDADWDKLRPLALERLKNALAKKNNRDVAPDALLDLKRIDLSNADLAKDEDLQAVARSTAWRRREADLEVLARVAKVTKSQAIFDLGTGDGVLPLASVAWARAFSPAAFTPAPKGMDDVLKVGDLALVRVAKIVPCDDAAKAKNKCTDDRIELALEQHPQAEGALISIDPRNRGVLALVGGYDHKRSPFNRATQAKRQPGSSFKPIVYATALEVGQERALIPESAAEMRERCIHFHPRQEVYDTEEEIPDKWTGKKWHPQNFERNEFAGRITMRQALAESKNTVAVKLLFDIGCEPQVAGMDWREQQQHGLDKVKDMARRVGIDSPVADSMTSALGSSEVVPLELVNAYATLAMDGRYAAPVLVKRVRAPNGEILFETKTTFEQPPPLVPGQPPMPTDPKARGIRADLAFVTSQVMRSVIEDPNGTARSLQQLGRPIAGKTGTASEHRDAWFVGFTPEAVTGVWVGFDNHDLLGGHETGGHAAGPIWLKYMKVAEDKLEHREWIAPAGVVTAQIDPRSGLLADEHSPFVETEYYLAGTEPKSVAPPADEAKTEDFMRDGPP